MLSIASITEKLLTSSYQNRCAPLLASMTWRLIATLITAAHLPPTICDHGFQYPAQRSLRKRRKYPHLRNSRRQHSKTVDGFLKAAGWEAKQAKAQRHSH